jgi:hypothetical protein
MASTKRRSRTKPSDIKIQERRRQALELRKAGTTFERIGDLQGTSRSTAQEDVQTAMRETIQEPADEVRRMELERIDAMLKALWPTAMQTGSRGQTRAVEVCLQLSARRSALQGLDAPQRKIVEMVSEDALDEAIMNLRSEIAAFEAAGPGD